MDENELLSQQIVKLSAQMKTLKSSAGQSEGLNQIVEKLTADQAQTESQLRQERHKY